MRPEAETIPGVLRQRIEADGDRQALVTTETAVTYRQLDEESGALAARLVGGGVVKGDRVALLAPNGVEWAGVALAVMRVGAVLVPLSTLLRPPELIAQLRTASVTHVILVPEFRQRSSLEDLEEAAPGLVAAARAGKRHPAAPSLRRLWAMEELPDVAARAAVVVALEDRVRPADD